MKKIKRFLAYFTIFTVITQITPIRTFAAKSTSTTTDTSLTITTTITSAAIIAETTGSEISNWYTNSIVSTSADPLEISGSNILVNGDIHTNGNFIFNGSKLDLQGKCEASGEIKINGSKITIGSKLENAAILDIPNFYDSIKNTIKSDANLITEDKKYSGKSVTINKPTIINGNVSFDTSNFNGTSYIVADKNITFNVSSFNKDQNEQLMLCSGNGDITINCSRTNLNGIIYAPNGTVTLNTSSLILKGKIIAKKIIFKGSTLSVTNNDDVLDMMGIMSLSATRNFGIPKLQWEAIEGATYQVERGETKDKLEIISEDITKNTFTDINSKFEKEYYYRVIVKKDGENFSQTNIVKVNSFIDTDRDGISDEQEATYKTDPQNPDTDGDKLNDGLEVLIYHTNPLIKDTDGDRLTDGQEVSFCGTSPTNKDTDGNRITDDLEDPDKDAIDNYNEFLLGSDPKLDDSDFDGLTDDKELVYKTDMINHDTDDDGFTDGNGVKDGEEFFTTNIGINSLEKDEKVEPSIEMSLKGKNIDTVSISNVGNANPYLNKNIPGYIGAPFQFFSKEAFDNAKMTMIGENQN